MKLRGRVVAVPLLVITLLQGVAFAQPANKPATPAPATPAPTAPTAPTTGAPQTSDEQTKKDLARDHFQKGLTLFDEEAWDAALAEFMTSRSIFPTRSATKNAALCLHKLHRFDEAVDMFEELLKFPNLSADDQALADRELKTLRGLVGTIALNVSEAGAAVAIDGNDRGAAPLPGPVRVNVGTHVIRVYKDGFQSFEKRVEVAGGQAQTIDVALHGLAQSGRLKVAEERGKVLDVVVDNVVVGKTPWEGALAPGDHSVVLRGEGNVGTQPASAPVKLNQMTPLTLLAENLPAGLHVDSTPAGAMIAIDGVNVGRGVWDGHLRAGKHTIETAQEGFLPFSRAVDLAADKREVVAAQLERDPNSALWAENRARFVLEIDGAFVFAPSLGGDIVGGCSSPCTKSAATGFLAVGRGIYQFRSGFGLGIEAGYLSLSTSVTNRATVLTSTGPTDPGTAIDSLKLRGVVAGASASMHVGSKFPVTLRLGAGALLGSLNDQRTGTFTTVARPGKPTETYTITPVDEAPAATYVYLTPEVRVAIPIGDHFEVSAGVAALVLIGLKQPTWTPSDRPIAMGLPPVPNDGQGAFGADALAGKTIVGFAPGLGARYAF